MKGVVIMGMIDYGTLVKVNGKIINEGIMFMEKSDLGIIPVDSAYDEYNPGDVQLIRDKYFAYAGDEELMICFYKNLMTFVSGDKYLGCVSMGQPWHEKYDSKNMRYGLFNEKLFNPFNCGIDVRFESLDPNIQHCERAYDGETIYEDGEELIVKSYWKLIKDAYGLSDVYGSKTYTAYRKMCKNLRRKKNFGWSVWGRHYDEYDVSDRFYVTFQYNGNTYEIVTGYGIDWNRSFYTEENMNRFGYTEKEQEFMRRFLIQS